MNDVKQPLFDYAFDDVVWYIDVKNFTQDGSWFYQTQVAHELSGYSGIFAEASEQRVPATGHHFFVAHLF